MIFRALLLLCLFVAFLRAARLQPPAPHSTGGLLDAAIDEHDGSL